MFNLAIPMLGDPVPRIDGIGKVDGTEKFGDDVGPPDALAIRLIRSPFHSARFEFGDLEQFVSERDWVNTVLTANDVSGRNCFGVFPEFADQPVFAECQVRFRGEAVAAVVGAAESIRSFR